MNINSIQLAIVEVPNLGLVGTMMELLGGEGAGGAGWGRGADLHDRARDVADDALVGGHDKPHADVEGGCLEARRRPGEQDLQPGVGLCGSLLVEPGRGTHHRVVALVLFPALKHVAAYHDVGAGLPDAQGHEHFGPGVRHAL